MDPQITNQTVLLVPKVLSFGVEGPQMIFHVGGPRDVAVKSTLCSLC